MRTSDFRFKMAPPWIRTLAAIPPKILRFSTIPRPSGFPLVAIEGINNVSTYRPQNSAGFVCAERSSSASYVDDASSLSRWFWNRQGQHHFLPNASFCSSATTTVSMTPDVVKKEMGMISDKFGEALELLNDARSSAGTVYFSEDMKDAEEMVENTLSHYKGLLAKLDADARLDVQRSIGLKMEELKAQFQMIKDSIRD